MASLLLVVVFVVLNELMKDPERVMEKSIKGGTGQLEPAKKATRKMAKGLDKMEYLILATFGCCG
eukprot:3234806-Ditylum_brightwellii.AAC.1